MPCKNITRYTYETTAFQGYRLAICKNKRLFTRYFRIPSTEVRRRRFRKQ